MHYPLRFVGPVCAFVAATLVPLPTLAAQEAPEGLFTLESGQRFHQTDRVVLDRHSIAVPNSDLELHLWRELGAEGASQAYYAVSRDGILQGRVRATTYDVRLRDVRFDPLALAPPAVSLDLEARCDNRLHLVQFYTTPLPEFRAAVQALGGTVLRFLTDHTFVVDLPETALSELAQLPYVRWTGDYQPAYRLEAELRQAIEGRGADLERQRYSIMLGQRSAEAQAGLAERIGRLGGAVELVEGGGVRVEASLTQAQLLEVVHDNRVLFIDRWGGPGELDMDIVREVGGGDYVEGVAGFTGAGVRGEVFDSELRTTHQEWPSPPMLHSNGSSCGPLHGTSSYSNNFAQGTSAAARGMIPDAQGIFFCLGESTQFGGPTSRYDANAELIDPAGPYRAVFQTSSAGSARTTSYTTLSAEVDDYLFLHQILSTQSQSNAGNQLSRPQAWAKNIVSVGAFNHEGTADRCDDNWSFTASIGPAADGRVKPDLAFFFDSILSASGGSDTSYTFFGGTSSATPQTSGHFGLLFQMWHEGVWAGHGGTADVFTSRPNMATAKALMINSAFRYDWF
ncbi:MAG: S8 family serine peptidase, partial [Acidobacteriota bacterium]